MEYSAAPSRHALEPRKLAQRLLLRLRRHLRVGDRLPEILGLRSIAAAFTELLLDLVQPLAQHGLLLTFIEGFARAFVDLPRDLQHLDPRG